ncbi:hypothetical protein F2P81_008632 [Scophthalmus maximus]|uniref:Uncharacterized protein n=1 Tax=Scophthalmus maximus TaxID=52904 RepID=A0A6A4T1G2_SCOMX|nr:hypothetical protein F2P81_008632 [Scophthalmus maximus]
MNHRGQDREGEEPPGVSIAVRRQPTVAFFSITTIHRVVGNRDLQVYNAKIRCKDKISIFEPKDIPPWKSPENEKT